MDSDSSPQGVSIYCWFSFQPAKSPLTLCTQGVEGGELTGYWPTELTCHVDSSVGLGPWEITELAFPKATSAPTTVNHLLLREHRIRTVIHTYRQMFLNCNFLWKGYICSQRTEKFHLTFVSEIRNSNGNPFRLDYENMKNRTPSHRSGQFEGT